MNENAASSQTSNRLMLIVTAWVGMLLMSDLVDILANALTGGLPTWLASGKLGWAVVFLVLCLVFKPLRPLWQFALVMVVFFISIQVSNWLQDLPAWQNLFKQETPTFFVGFLEIFLRDSIIMAAVIAVLWLVKRDRREFFLTRGTIQAPIQPVRWLGIKAGESWRTFGWIFGGVAAALVLIPTVLGLKPSGETLLRAAGLLPAVLLFAGINAFNEEMYYRASMLSTLPLAIGKTHALMISITFFGLAHFLYGSPPGIVGFAMTGFLAFLMGKAMLETKGVFWPWLIHLLPDIVIFFSYAISWVKP